MRADQLRGLGVAMITPFTQSGEVDFPALDSLVDRMLEGNIDYFVILGTTGETPTLLDHEILNIISLVKEKVDGRKPIVLGVGGNDTMRLVAKIKKTDFSGIDAILSVTPYYNKPNQEGLIAHYTCIADASPVPVILYNVPGRTGVALSVETTLALANHPNIIGTKEASGQLDGIGQLIALKPADFLVISGDDALAVPMISMGGAGAISVLGNAFPAECTQMINAALEDDFVTASKINSQFSQIYSALFVEGNPTGVKAILSLRGQIENKLRLPLVPASDELICCLRDLL